MLPHSATDAMHLESGSLEAHLRGHNAGDELLCEGVAGGLALGSAVLLILAHGVECSRACTSTVRPL